MVIGPDLRVALANLYETFSRYPLPDSTEVCDHCVAPETVEAIRAVPLRHLSAATMSRDYVWNVSTWGGIEDFKHYLPRLLELMIGEELDRIEAPVLARWLGAHWSDWPQDERDAVVVVVDAWWRHTLQHYPRDIDVMEMFEIIGGNLRLDLHDCLTVWETIGGEAAALHVAWLVEEYDTQPPYGEDWVVLLEGWIEGPAPARILEAALAVPSSRDVEKDLARALALHRQWPRA